ncbi:aminoglycoside phosphotransferase family protein [Rothia sp. CCM 9417]|uniref:aminoglycoside phosphotransferase family protein n=1 Tax=Rothia sp. CCM 9417 TaxID=3402657 RepID=UPI003AEEF12F
MDAVTIDQELIHEVIGAVAPEQTLDQVVHLGTSSVVALTEDLAIRIARNTEVAKSILRTQKLVDALPEYSFGLPRSAGEPLQEERVTAVPTLRLWGEPHAAGRGNTAVLYGVLQEIRATSTSHIRPYLAEPRAFCGGKRWRNEMLEQVIPLLSYAAQERALAIINDLSALQATLDTSQLVFSHVDLAGTNMLFEGGKVSGILDWDLATVDDPAIDIACLAAWHGDQFIRLLARTREEAERAMLFRLSHPLQVIAFSILHKHPKEQVDALIARAEERLLKNY